MARGRLVGELKFKGPIFKIMVPFDVSRRGYDGYYAAITVLWTIPLTVFLLYCLVLLQFRRPL